jgi:hypothetical protein
MTGLRSDLDEARSREVLGFDGLFDVLCDDEGYTPAQRPEDTGISNAFWVDAHAVDGAILAQLVWPVVLGLPVLDLLAASVVDTADDTESVEDVPRPRVTIYLGWNELHPIHAQLLEQSDEAVMDYWDAESCQAELKWVTGKVERESRSAPKFKNFSFLELPRVDFVSFHI